jgi:flagellin FlaB
MNKFFRHPKIVGNVLSSERGITGLETAIVVIAFVVVSSVFAFAALSTGMFSSDKARETVNAGLAQTRATLELKGSVIGSTGTAPTSGALAKLSKISFHVTQSAGGADVDLTPGTTIIKFTDDTQSKLFASTSGFTLTGIGGADSDNLLERNEVYKIELIDLETGLHDTNDDTLKTALGVSTTFTLEVIPTKGAVLHIERTTPIFLDLINFLN